jgi:radical SAM superfamily enzyme YgiQ (UPF0313 family)
MIEKNKNGTKKKLKKEIWFFNPSIGIAEFKRDDILRTYLALGTLISAIKEKRFLRKFALLNEKNELIFDNYEDYPDFNIKVIQLSLRGKQSVKEYFNHLQKKSDSSPIMICATATSAQLEEVRDLAIAAKELEPAALRIIGGPHVTVDPEGFLKNSDFDIVCIGEGVETFVELVLKCVFKKEKNIYCNIPGIAFKKEDKEIVINKDRECLFLLDDYPFPSNSLTEFIPYLQDNSKNANSIVYILGGFGCHFDCAFCAQKAIHKGKIRDRSADNIFFEIKQLYSKGFRRFAIVQETFTGDNRRIDRFCSLIEYHSLDIEWTAESRADQVDYNKLIKMKKSGLKFIQIGLESGDQNLLDKVGKGVRLDRARVLIKWLKQLQINTAVYLLVGLPGQDWQSILKTAVFFTKNLPYNSITMHASTSIAIPYPGTDINKKSKVRITEKLDDNLSSCYNCQARKPEITVKETGEFEGENHTETDVMTSNEIMESLIYLDDMCYSFLHVRYDKSLNMEERHRFLEYGKKLLYMIERRTIRDLIIQSQRPMDSIKKQNLLERVSSFDKGKETHFKDVAKNFELYPDVFKDFLTGISFINGFDTLRNLSVENRVKFMKLCCILWIVENRKFKELRFLEDNFDKGVLLNKNLDILDTNNLDNLLKNDDILKTVEINNVVSKHLQQLGIIYKSNRKVCMLSFKRSGSSKSKNTLDYIQV